MTPVCYRSFSGIPPKTSVSIAIERLGHLETLLADVQSGHSVELQTALNKHFEEFLQLSTVLKLSLFCRAYRPIALANVLKALRFSSRTISFVMAMQSRALHDDLAELSYLPVATRGQARWVANLGREPIGVLYLLMTEMLDRQIDLEPVRLLIYSFFSTPRRGDSLIWSMGTGSVIIIKSRQARLLDVCLSLWKRLS